MSDSTPVDGNGKDGRTLPRVSVSFSDPDVLAALRSILVRSLGHWGDSDHTTRLALWSIYHRLLDAENRLRSKATASGRIRP